MRQPNAYIMLLLFLPSISIKETLALDEPFSNNILSLPKPILKKNDYWNSGKVYPSLDEEPSHTVSQPFIIPEIIHELERASSEPNIFSMTHEEDNHCNQIGPIQSQSNKYCLPPLDLPSLHIQELQDAIQEIQEYSETHKNFKNFSNTLQSKINAAQSKLLSIRSHDKAHLIEMKKLQNYLLNIQKKNIKRKKCFLRLQLFLFHH